MSNNLFTETSFSLSAKEVLQNLRMILEIGNSAYIKPREDIDYSFDDPFDPTILSVIVEGTEPQNLLLELEEITFGERAYFRCKCDARVNKIYITDSDHEFKCRKCHKLHYQLTTFNRHSVAGKTLYQMNRLHKLSSNRANISRILYDGKFTKKFSRFLNLCNKAGLENFVKGSNELKALLDC